MSLIPCSCLSFQCELMLPGLSTPLSCSVSLQGTLCKKKGDCLGLSLDLHYPDPHCPCSRCAQFQNCCHSPCSLLWQAPGSLTSFWVHLLTTNTQTSPPSQTPLSCSPSGCVFQNPMGIPGRVGCPPVLQAFHFFPCTFAAFQVSGSLLRRPSAHLGMSSLRAEAYPSHGVSPVLATCLAHRKCRYMWSSLMWVKHVWAVWGKTDCGLIQSWEPW